MMDLVRLRQRTIAVIKGGTMRFILIYLCVAFLFIDVVLILGLINNYEGIVSLPWWKIFLGPLSWLVTDFCDEIGRDVTRILDTALCIWVIILEVRHDCILWRVASFVAVVYWVLFGLSAIFYR
jgi:hypothetical protein